MTHVRLVSLGTLLTASLAAQQPPVFRANTRVVPIYATVAGADGRLLPGLTQGDFTVLDNGRPQPITVFSDQPTAITGLAMWDVSPAQAPSARPTKLVLLYDNSNSQHLVLYGRTPIFDTTGMPYTRDEVARTVATNLDAHTSVRVASFGERILLSSNWVRTRAEIQQAFESVTQDGGPSPIWDGVYSVVEALEATADRRVILLFSDGKASANVHSFAEALERAKRSAVTVNVVVVPANKTKTLEADRPGDPAERLKRMADATGGRYAERPLKELPEFCGEFVKGLRRSSAPGADPRTSAQQLLVLARALSRTV